MRTTTILLCVALAAVPSQAWPRSLGTASDAGSFAAEPVDPVRSELLSPASLARIRRGLSTIPVNGSMRIASCAPTATVGSVERGWSRDCVDRRWPLAPQPSTGSAPNRKAGKKILGAVLLAAGTGLIIESFTYESPASRACLSGKLPPGQTIAACSTALNESDSVHLKKTLMWVGGFMSAGLGAGLLFR